MKRKARFSTENYGMASSRNFQPKKSPSISTLCFLFSHHAMAEAVLEVVLDNLSSLIRDELGLFLGVDQEMRRLESILSTVKAVLQDAEHKQLTESDEALKNWLSKLKDATHMLDDILHRCSTEALSLEYQALTCGSALKVQGSCFSSIHPKHVLFRRKIAKKMKDMRERLDEIAEERSKFHLREIVTERRRIEVPEWRQTASTITESHVYGRDDDKKRIVDFLVDDASNLEDLCVYPIIGIGGLGKTTLSQLVFKDERVVNHFEQRIWLCVSEDFSLKRMVKAIIESASRHACEDLDLDPLQRRLQELLQRKNYLLVLDDVWNENQEKWDKLKHVLACGSKGASILVTTRLGKVASIMGTVPSFELSMLSKEYCWELFKQRAFVGHKGERAELVAIGKQIVNKCKGVPLAAKALGGLLQFKTEERDWVLVKESEIWNLPQDEYLILPSLRLSYLLDMVYMNAVPFSIGHLKLLRRLNLSHGKFETLPDSICILWNLQILTSDFCVSLQKLPNRMRCLKSLGHLHLNMCKSLSSLAPNMGQLTSLKTLSKYIVGKQKGFLLAELGHMKLKGCLWIEHLERVTSVMDAKEANMADKHLNVLVLSWNNNEDSQSQENVEQILEVLQPNPQQLRTLFVEGYMGAQLPTELSNLNALERLEIWGCNNLKTITEQVLQGLHSLKILQLEDLQMFNFSAGFRFLTSLEYLWIFNCPEVKDLPETLQHLVNLQSLIF